MFENEVEMQDTNAEYSEESYEDLFLDSEDEETEDTNEETEYEEDDEDYEEEEEGMTSDYIMTDGARKRKFKFS